MSSSWLQSEAPTAVLLKPDTRMTMELLLVSSGHEALGLADPVPAPRVSGELEHSDRTREGMQFIRVLDRMFGGPQSASSSQFYPVNE